jgi:hypothetical protein
MAVAEFEVWDIEISKIDSFLEFATKLALPYSLTNGAFSGVWQISISLNKIVSSPMPSAFITASFAAKCPAKCCSGFKKEVQ